MITQGNLTIPFHGVGAGGITDKLLIVLFETWVELPKLNAFSAESVSGSYFPNFVCKVSQSTHLHAAV